MAALADDPQVNSPEHAAFSAYAELVSEKRKLSERLKEIEAELQIMEPTLLGYLGQGGYEMVRISGFTISPKREPWVYPAYGVSRQAVCNALKESGLGYMVTENYSTRSLTKYVRELEEHHQLLGNVDPQAALCFLPAPLERLVEVKPGYRLQVLARHNK